MKTGTKISGVNHPAAEQTTGASRFCRTPATSALLERGHSCPPLHSGKRQSGQECPRSDKSEMRPRTTELLILADGRILARNLTPALARVLREVNPDDAGMSRRAGEFKSSPHSSPPPEPSIGNQPTSR